MLSLEASNNFIRIAIVFCFASLMPVTAQAKGKDTKKTDAPNLEDHANYFSESRQGVSSEAKKKADVLRQKTITSIKALLKDKSKSARRFELLVRLGELYVERHDYLRDVELEDYDKKITTWEKTATDKRGKEPQINHQSSIAQLTMAANTFRQLVNEFPKHNRTDLALYSLGKTLARLGKGTAVNYYQQLIKTFPKSPLIPDSYLALGEFYFERHQIDEAVANYKSVLKFKKHRAYPYAVYKLGWAYYNVNAKNDADAKKNLKKAVAAFKLVVKLSDRQKKDDGVSSNLDLRQEAIRDLIVVWADAEDVNSAWRYFKQIGERDSFYTMLERLGSIYTENGENKKAIVVYTRLLRESPNRPNNPEIAARLVNLYDLVGDNTNAVATLEMMKNTYIKGGTWVQANASSQEQVAEAEQIVEKNLHRYGTLFHSRGQKQKNNRMLGSGATVYTYYLDSFPENSNSYEIRYYLSEILFEFKKFEAAADNYVKVSRQVPNGKYMKPAALNAVVSMNNLVTSKEKGYQKLPPAGQVTKPVEIPREKQRLVEVIDNYVALLPKEKEGEPMRFTAAQTYFDHGHYEAAVNRYGKLIEEIPETKQAKTSVKLILGFYAEKQQWENVVVWSKKFLENKKLLDKELAQYITDMLRGSMFKQALVYEKAGDFEKSAAAFLDYQKAFPTDSNADRALYNAIVAFYKVSRIEDAIDVSNKLLKEYPKSDLAPNTIVQMSETYEGLAQFEDAAKYYLRLAQGYPQEARAPLAMFNAAILYKGLNNQDLAIKILSDFKGRYAKDKLAPQASLELADLQYARGDFRGAAVSYEHFAKNYGNDAGQKIYAEARISQITAFQINKERGERMLADLQKRLTAKDAPAAFEAREIVAQSAFRMLEGKFVAFKATKIAGGAQLEKQVSLKQDKLLELASGYETVIAIGNGEHIVAAFYRLGEAHEDFAQALFTAPAPPGASQSDLDRFRTELEKVAFPLKEEAYKFFETAYKRSQEVETFSPWTQRAYRKMVELAPDKHPKVNEMSADASYMTHEVKWDTAVAGLVVE